MHFYLIASKANHHVLYYRFDPTETTGHNPVTTCKVDIVFPGTTSNLSNLPLSTIDWDEGLPLVPFPLLLLLKLQEWNNHRKSNQVFTQSKQQIVMEDIMTLLRLSKALESCGYLIWTDTRVFSWDFRKLSEERIVNFCDAFPESKELWLSIGVGSICKNL
jgi:hypothetical protein